MTRLRRPISSDFSGETWKDVQRGLYEARATWGGGWIPDLIAIAPGRIEILGNHVDYNGGPVLAAAINRTTAILAKYSARDEGRLETLFCDVGQSKPCATEVKSLHGWRSRRVGPQPIDYVRGVVASSIDRGLRARGGQYAVAGSVPIGVGLSSSAALCVALTMAIVQPAMSGRALVLRSQEAEHRAGTPCGTMDQSASVHGHVIKFDGATLDSDQLQPDLTGFVFVVVDSGVSRSLGKSSYVERVHECDHALRLLQTLIDPVLPSLAKLRREELVTIDRLPKARFSSQLRRRVRHVVSEVERVGQGLKAMEKGDWESFGRLMNESGISSAVDYEISHPRVEELVMEMRLVSGVAGARMMGGGEGGSALALVDAAAVDNLRSKLASGYLRRYGLSARAEAVHQLEFARGASKYDWSGRNHYP